MKKKYIIILCCSILLLCVIGIIFWHISSNNNKQLNNKQLNKNLSLPFITVDGKSESFTLLDNDTYYYIFNKVNVYSSILFTNIDTLSIDLYVFAVGGGGGGSGGNNRFRGYSGLGGEYINITYKKKDFNKITLVIGDGGQGGLGTDNDNNNLQDLNEGNKGGKTIINIDNNDFEINGGAGGKYRDYIDAQTIELNNNGIDSNIYGPTIKYSGSRIDHVNNIGSGGLGGDFKSNGQNGKNGCVIVKLVYNR